MIVIDTNIVVRLLVNDDRSQVRRAARLVASGPVSMLTSVVMEVEWVLRKTYAFSPADITRALRAFMGLDSVKVEAPDTVEQALDAYVNGMDFADALHLSQAAGMSSFATFDKSLQKSAKRLGGFVPVVAP